MPPIGINGLGLSQPLIQANQFAVPSFGTQQTSLLAPTGVPGTTFQAQGVGRPINNVLIIDDFDNMTAGGFVHGQSVEQSLLGQNPNLNVTRANINATTGGNLLQGLRGTTDQLVAAARAGGPLPDAINISAYSFGNDQDTVAIRENLRTLAQAGVTIGIIAGKQVGPDGRPQLGGTPRANTLIPMGTPNVITADATGERIPGANVTGEGNETSFGLPAALGRLSTQAPQTVPSTGVQPGTNQTLGGGDIMSQLREMITTYVLGMLADLFGGAGVQQQANQFLGSLGGGALPDGTTTANQISSGAGSY
jgi:hypothetical protein